MTENKRKGARTQKDIPENILKLLNEGLIESVNLTEWLSVDHVSLINNVLPLIYQTQCLKNIESLQSITVMSMIKSIGTTLWKESKSKNDSDLFDILKTHQSDSVRCWAVYVIGCNSNLTIEQKLDLIQPFAADSHFGVREIAWLAVRDDIDKNLEKSISILQIWSKNEDHNIRRFSSESIRPNGVWCKKIDRLKNEPEIALPILENLKSDPSKYVQDSVGNWLNDASKTQPLFVKSLCDRWAIQSPTKETEYIIKRALRSLNKK